MDEQRSDFVVVGGGGAGAVVARRLADDGRFSVTLLEAGPSDEADAAVLDIYRSEEVIAGPLGVRLPVDPQASGNSAVLIPLARVLGGCTSHNTGLWFPTPASDLAAWERLGATGWGPEGTAAARARLAERVRCETLAIEQPTQLAMFDACRQAGLAELDFAVPFDAGVGRVRFSKAGRRRQSASVTYLHPLAALPKTLSIRTNTAAERLLIEPDGRVSGVAAGGRAFRASREVIVAAGAFGSPKLLMLSGLGPAAHLRDLGIAVVRDLPGVGGHLLDHPDASVNWRAARPLERHEPWSYGCIAFAQVEADAAWPDIEIQLLAQPVAKHLPAGAPAIEHGFSAYLTVNRTRSQGTVRLASPDPRHEPRIDPRWFSDPYDMRIMVGGLRLARRIFAQPAFDGWLAAEAGPGAHTQSDDALAAFVRATHGTGYHAAGTCRMGRSDDPQVVVGPDLRVRGVRDLRIADASVFPAMVSVNIAATCMMVGEKAAEMILSDG